MNYIQDASWGQSGLSLASYTSRLGTHLWPSERRTKINVGRNLNVNNLTRAMTVETPTCVETNLIEKDLQLMTKVVCLPCHRYLHQDAWRRCRARRKPISGSAFQHKKESLKMLH